MFSNCIVVLIESNAGAKWWAQKDGWPQIFAASWSTCWSTKHTELRVRLPELPLTLRQNEVRWGKGEFVILWAFALREQNMDGWGWGWGCGGLQKMKTWVERQLVQYNQLWHKYWMNANKECRMDVKRSRPQEHKRHLLFTKHALSSGLSVALGWFGPGQTNSERKSVKLSSVNTIWRHRSQLDICSALHWVLSTVICSKEQQVCPSVWEPCFKFMHPPLISHSATKGTTTNVPISHHGSGLILYKQLTGKQKRGTRSE